MAVMIESLIGILLFTVLIVSLTLKNPLTSVGDYPRPYGRNVWN